jgi:hypothetical protein
MLHPYEGGLRPSSPICGGIEYALRRWEKLTIGIVIIFFTPFIAAGLVFLPAIDF